MDVRSKLKDPRVHLRISGVLWVLHDGRLESFTLSADKRCLMRRRGDALVYMGPGSVRSRAPTGYQVSGRRPRSISYSHAPAAVHQIENVSLRGIWVLKIFSLWIFSVITLTATPSLFSTDFVWTDSVPVIPSFGCLFQLFACEVFVMCTAQILLFYCTFFYDES